MFIIDPITNNIHNIFTRQGKAILRKYINTFQKGGKNNAHKHILLGTNKYLNDVIRKAKEVRNYINFVRNYSDVQEKQIRGYTIPHKDLNIVDF